MKKLTAVLLSFLLCLPLLPGQVRATGLPEPPEPAAAEEPLAPETLDEPMLLMAEEMPEMGNPSNLAD